MPLQCPEALQLQQRDLNHRGPLTLIPPCQETVSLHLQCSKKVKHSWQIAAPPRATSWLFPHVPGSNSARRSRTRPPRWMGGAGAALPWTVLLHPGLVCDSPLQTSSQSLPWSCGQLAQCQALPSPSWPRSACQWTGVASWSWMTSHERRPPSNSQWQSAHHELDSGIVA